MVNSDSLVGGLGRKSIVVYVLKDDLARSRNTLTQSGSVYQWVRISSYFCRWAIFVNSSINLTLTWALLIKRWMSPPYNMLLLCRQSHEFRFFAQLGNSSRRQYDACREVEEPELLQYVDKAQFLRLEYFSGTRVEAIQASFVSQKGGCLVHLAFFAWMLLEQLTCQEVFRRILIHH